MRLIRQKKVGKKYKRYYAKVIDILTFRRTKMTKQAKTLTTQELRRVLDYISTRKHAARNRAMLLTMFYGGLRVGETASLRFEDVLDSDGKVRKEIRLDADQTKGRQGRVVYVCDKLSKELERYIAQVPSKEPSAKLFYTQKRETDGFSANTLTQLWHYLFRNAGIEGASSHSPRRTFITNLAAKGVGVRVLMNLAGHKHIGTTQAYIDVNDEMLRKAVELI